MLSMLAAPSVTRMSARKIMMAMHYGAHRVSQVIGVLVWLRVPADLTELSRLGCCFLAVADAFASLETGLTAVRW